MKKLKYERPEVEIELLDPELDIIRTSDNGNAGPNSLNEEFEKEVIGL